MGIDEPTVRSTKHPRPSKRRLPADAVVVTVRVDDHLDGTVYASLASPDGERWKAYAYWPVQDPQRSGTTVAWTADGGLIVDGVPLDRLDVNADGSARELPAPLDSDG